MVESNYMDGYLKQGLSKAKKVVSKDWDWVVLIDGVEGGGKSVLTQQCAKEVDPTFCIERIAFTPEEFKDAIHKAKKYQAVIYDEAYTGLSSRGTMSDINKTLVQMLAEIRQKNLFVFIVMPTFFDLDRYAAIWRSKVLLHVYVDNEYERGRFCFYNKDRKKNLYILGKKFYNYGKPRPNFRGRFTNYYAVNEEEYRAKKLKALSDHKSKADIKEEERLPYVLRALCNHVSLRQAEQELKLLGLEISDSTIKGYIRKIPSKIPLSNE
jgi:hypothetical protein